MNWKLIGLWVIVADFAALSAYAVWQYGYVGLFEQAIANPAAWQISADLVIALGLIAVWMVRDARERGISVVPYLVTTAVIGSFGPLLYLIRRERVMASRSAAVSAGNQRVPA